MRNCAIIAHFLFPNAHKPHSLKTNLFKIMEENQMKNSIRKFNVRKFRLAAIKLAITACTIAMAMCSTIMMSFAANSENSTPAGSGGTTTMNTAVDIVFWVVRIAIVLIGGVPGVIKIVQGQADENPRDRNAGLATIGITGVAFAATFMVKALI